MLTFISGSLIGKTIKEEIYSCTNNFGEVAVRVFFNPKVYCQDNPTHPATLVKESRYGATVYDGTLTSTESGAVFKFKQTIDENEFILELNLPHEMGKGSLRSIYDRDVSSELDLNCIIKQIHVECEP